MKKTVSCLTIHFLFVFTIYAANIYMDIPLSDVSVRSNQGYAEFEAPAIYSEPGCPLLPTKRYILIVPPDADLSTVSFRIQGLDEKVLDDTYKVKPALPPAIRDCLVWPKDRNIVNGKDIDVYSSNEYYPNDYIQEVFVGKLRCYKIVEVRVYFSKFNPVSGKLKCITDGKLVLNVTRESLEKEVRYKIPAKFQKLARKIAANYDEMAPAYNSIYSFTENTKYLIMTEFSIESSSDKLAELKKSKEEHGFDVEIVTESTWGGGTGSEAAENIRSWLKSNYESMGIEYVLFIGSSQPYSGTVPMRITEGSNNMDVPTDFYYQDISGDWENKDGHAEVCAGRIPVYSNDINTLDNILQKIIEYENKPVESIEWRKNAFLIANPFDNETPGSYLFEAVKTNILDPQGWDYYRIYDDNNGNPDESNCTMDAVENAWKNHNFGLVEWVAHGNATGAQDVMFSSTTSELSDEYPPIVFMGSCSNAEITNSNNLTYSMLKNTGITAIGGTNLTSYLPGQKEFDSTSYIQGFAYELARGIVVDSLGTGDALDKVCSISDNKKWHNIQAFNLFGCPDVGIFTAAQEQTPIHNISLGPGKGVKSSRLIAISTKDNKVNFLFAAKCGDIAVTLTVYDLLGNLLFKRSEQKSLQESFKLEKLYTWDLNKHCPVASGMYIAMLYIKDRATGHVACVKNKVFINKR